MLRRRRYICVAPGTERKSKNDVGCAAERSGVELIGSEMRKGRYGGSFEMSVDPSVRWPATGEGCVW